MTRRSQKLRLTLASLIDLEIQLQQDQAIAPEILQERDATIGLAIEADRLNPPAVFLAWLAELRHNASPAGSSRGARIEQLIGLFGMLLIVCGVLLGVAAMSGWLAFDTQRHINVLFFWTTMIGIQILLLGVWFLAALPSSWLVRLPGGGSLQTLCRAIGRLPVGLLGWIATRISPEYRRGAHEIAGDLKQMDWLYGNLRRWILIRLTQVFALAFNIAAIAAFVALTYGNDPTFGWRSTMLNDRQMHCIMQVVALPWAEFWPEAVPTLEQVQYVKDSSKENIQVMLSPEQRIQDLRMWSSLWPFLLASLVCYGLLPRMFTWLISVWQVHRRVHRARLDHYAAAALLRRLRRPLVVSGSRDASEPLHESLGKSAEINRSARCGQETVPVLKWAGVDLDEAEISRWLASRFEITISWLAVVGQLDPQVDAEALTRLKAEAECKRVLLLVEAWEPPDADYLDFIQRLRDTMVARAAIDIVLYNHQGVGRAAACDPQDWRVWRERLAALGDPYLAIDQLCEPRQSDGRGGGDA